MQNANGYAWSFKRRNEHLSCNSYTRSKGFSSGFLKWSRPSITSFAEFHKTKHLITFPTCRTYSFVDESFFIVFIVVVFLLLLLFLFCFFYVPLNVSWNRNSCFSCKLSEATGLIAWSWVFIQLLSQSNAKFIWLFFHFDGRKWHWPLTLLIWKIERIRGQ